MKTTLSNYFYFSKTQRNGLVIVLCLLFLTFFLSNILSDHLAKPQTDFSAFEKEINEFEEERTALKKDELEKKLSDKIQKDYTPLIQLTPFNPNSVTKEELIQMGLESRVASTFIKFRNTGAKFYKKEDLKKVYGLTDTDYNRLAPYVLLNQKKSKPKKEEKPKIDKQPIQKTLTPFTFNPNDATKEILLEIGFSEKVAQTIINFRSKGGKFWKKQDLKKIYGLTEKDYLTIEPFIEIAPSELISANKTTLPNAIPKSFSTAPTIKVDINNSKVEDWKKLRGIGEMTAKRIVNFRDKLGGFTSIEQIKMVYNVPDSVIDKVNNQLIVSPIPNKILINSISADDLRLHPYIKTKQAHTIINYRTNHGSFHSIEDLHKVKALKPDFIERIQPYLSFVERH